MKNKKQSGFTIIELLIAVLIIGILASVSYPSYYQYTLRSDRSVTQLEIENIMGLMESFRVDQITYTTDLTQLGLTDPHVSQNGKYSISARQCDNGAPIPITQCVELVAVEIKANPEDGSLIYNSEGRQVRDHPDMGEVSWKTK